MRHRIIPVQGCCRLYQKVQRLTQTWIWILAQPLTSWLRTSAPSFLKPGRESPPCSVVGWIQWDEARKALVSIEASAYRSIVSPSSDFRVWIWSSLNWMCNSNLILALNPSGPGTAIGIQKSLISSCFRIGWIKETPDSCLSILYLHHKAAISSSPGPASLILVFGVTLGSPFFVPQPLVSSPAPEVLASMLLLLSPEMAASPQGPCLSPDSPACVVYLLGQALPQGDSSLGLTPKSFPSINSPPWSKDIFPSWSLTVPPTLQLGACQHPGHHSCCSSWQHRRLPRLLWEREAKLF